MTTNDLRLRQDVQPNTHNLDEAKPIQIAFHQPFYVLSFSLTLTIHHSNKSLSDATVVDC